MSSRRFLLRWVWHLAIPTPPAMEYSPTEYAEFTEPPAEMSSRRFLLRRVWHLAIPTPPAMGYSPTEFTEFTEPPAEKSLPRISQIYTDVRVRCSPTDFTDLHRYLGCAVLPQNSKNTQNLAAWVWQRCHTLLHLCHLWESFLSKRFCEFRAFCGNIFSPTDFTDLHRCLGCALFPQNSQNPQNLSAWVWQGCHTFLHLCASVSSVGGSSLQEVLCIRCIPWELLHHLFCWCS